MNINANTLFSVAILSAAESVVPDYDQYKEFDNSTDTYSTPRFYQYLIDYTRKRVVGNVMYIDLTITQTGFSGTEDIDWENISMYTGQTGNFRWGSRGGYWVLDCEITPTGFAGTEDVDWENLLTYKDPSSSETLFREGIRGGAYVVDQALSATGFSGVQNTDWINLVQLKPL